MKALVFKRYGGHSHAVGFAIASERIPALRAAMDAYARTKLTRADLEPAKSAMEAVGFVYRNVSGMHMFLDGPKARAREAVHIILDGEKVRPEYGANAPDVTESHAVADQSKESRTLSKRSSWRSSAIMSSIERPP